MPYTRSPPFRRRLWPSILTLATLLPFLHLPSTLAHPPTRRFAQDNGNSNDASQYLVHDLPGAPKPQLEQYAGHIEVTPEHHGNLFFWFFKSRKVAEKERLVIWFNGGPGCSSMDGALMEVGPYRVNEDGSLRVQEGGWDEYTNILFIDNPVGTGFSFVDGDSLVHDLGEMAEQIIEFLEKWFEIFSDYDGLDMYIAGESYAGQHIPYIAQAILDRNKKKPKNQWSLGGLLIGNGWISGEDQYKSYIPFMKEQGILKEGTTAADNADAQQAKCDSELANGGDKKVDVSTCEAIMMGLSRDLSSEGQCHNVYDVRLKDSYPSCGMSWPPDLKQLTPYLRRNDVRRALNLSPDEKAGWAECNNQVNFAFNAARSKPSKQLLPDLLQHMPILLFSGDKDLICNHIGTENVISTLEWNGAVGMENNGEMAPIREWTMDDEPAGQYQEARNLTYLKFYNSSHMVPFDYPTRARDMLDRFIGGDVDKINGKPKNSIIEGLDNDKQVVPPTDDKNQGDSKKPVPSSKPDTDDDEDDEDEWNTYYRSGEAALLVLLLALAGWGFFTWRSRRRRRLGYKHVMGDDPAYPDGRGANGHAGARSAFGLSTAEERFRNRERDLEALEEEELDELDAKGEKVGRDRFEVGDDDEWDYGSDDGGIEGSGGRKEGRV